MLNLKGKSRNNWEDIDFILRHIETLVRNGCSRDTIAASVRILCNRYDVDIQQIEKYIVNTKEGFFDEHE